MGGGVNSHSGLASVTLVSEADPAGATAGGNHSKSPCLTCPQSGRKVLISGGSTGAALWSVVSGIISWVSLPPEDLIEERRDERVVSEARWRERAECVSTCTSMCVLWFWCPEILFVRLSVWSTDGRTVGLISAAESFGVFWGKARKGNDERFLLRLKSCELHVQF